MSECALCHKKGIFLSLTQYSLCKECNYKVVLDVEQRGRVIQDSIRLVHESKNLETRLSRLKLSITHLEAIEHYEMLGIPTLGPLPSELKRKYEGLNDSIIEETIRHDFDDIKTRKDAGQTLTSLENNIVKMILRIKDNKANLRNGGCLDALEKEVVLYQNRIRLEHFLENARKAEFKGQKRKALDQYQEALYLLKNDKIDDASQEEQIMQVTEAVTRLSDTPDERQALTTR
jgi:hypothetical protein